MVLINFVLGVDTNARPKFKVATDDKLVAKFCNSVMHHQWYTFKLIKFFAWFLINFVLRVDVNTI